MRLKSELWVKAYLRRCQVNGAAVYVTRRGQSEGGAIFIKLNLLNGKADLYGPAPAGLEPGGGRRWARCLSDAPCDEREADAYLKRQAEFDPDLWVVEVEEAEGRHFLGDLLVDP